MSDRLDAARAGGPKTGLSGGSPGAMTDAAGLYCRDLDVRAYAGGARILKGIDAEFGEGRLHALVGPSGCGKTTLLKAFLGLIEAEGVKGGAALPEGGGGRPGFVPQFSLAHPDLTVSESLGYAFDLFEADGSGRAERLERVLAWTGLGPQAETRVGGLSGGQLRRLGLGLELVSEPSCLTCDEVTSGLDPLSEEEILGLLRELVDRRGKTLLCTIHNLGRLPDFDVITVLYEGCLVFQGDFRALREWFGIEDPLRLYHALGKRSSEDWAGIWREASGGKDAVAAAPEVGGLSGAEGTTVPASAAGSVEGRPSAWTQLRTLLNRRFRLLFRDTGYLWLLLALTFGFPCVVVVFALGGLPQIEGLAMERSGDFVERLMGDLRYRAAAADTATLVTGLIMFQAVLLSLMGANNGAREIAGERLLYEKERLKGLRAGAYVSSKLLFTAFVAALQGLWMALFVKGICQFPGPLLPQLGLLALCCVSMTFVCLGLSALLADAERASLLSIYLVGFQFPLSGVVLALPETLVWGIRPWINSYWAWGGYLASMREFQIYDAYRMADVSWLPGSGLAAGVLLAHMAGGAAMVALGCRMRRWAS